MLRLTSGQNCMNDCRVVCDPQLPSHSPPHASLRGKQGPKGERGDRGLPGNDCLDNGELVSARQRKISKLEKLVYKVLSKEVAEGKCFSLNFSSILNRFYLKEFKLRL